MDSAARLSRTKPEDLFGVPPPHQVYDFFYAHSVLGQGDENAAGMMIAAFPKDLIEVLIINSV